MPPKSERQVPHQHKGPHRRRRRSRQRQPLGLRPEKQGKAKGRRSRRLRHFHARQGRPFHHVRLARLELLPDRIDWPGARSSLRRLWRGGPPTTPPPPPPFFVGSLPQIFCSSSPRLRLRR